MILTLGRRAFAVAWLARLLLLVPAADLLAHDAIYRSLANGAAGRPQPLTDHDYWPLFVGLVVALAVGGTWPSLRRLWRLEGALRAAASGRLGAAGLAGARRSGSGAPGSGSGAPGYHRELALLWPVVTLATTGLFLVQENLEHLAATGSWFGLAPLDGRLHPDALAFVAAASLVVAALGALVRWRVRVLEGRLRAAVDHFPRPAPERVEGGWWLVAAVCRYERMLVRLDAGRAPPST